jgi:hypothetical protein
MSLAAGPPSPSKPSPCDHRFEHVRPVEVQPVRPAPGPPPRDEGAEEHGDEEEPPPR